MDMNKLMKQAQKVQREMAQKQEELAKRSFEVAAVNEAHRRAAEDMQKEMSSLMGGMGMPGMF
ncbi:MAG: hypothetical protein K8R69_03590 [Deltaproteobacteria bacterium]|nr:hypothetical protein [Deltaproteobacteria bacterium]